MYTAKIAEKKFENGQLLVNVEFTNGQDSFNEVHQVKTAEQLNEQIRSRINELSTLDTLVSSLSKGDYVVTEKPPKEDPVDEATAQVTWFRNWNKLITFNQLVEQGVLADDAEAVTSLRRTVQDTFDVNYID